MHHESLIGVVASPTPTIYCLKTFKLLFRATPVQLQPVQRMMSMAVERFGLTQMAQNEPGDQMRYVTTRQRAFPASTTRRSWGIRLHRNIFGEFGPQPYGAKGRLHRIRVQVDPKLGPLVRGGVVSSPRTSATPAGRHRGSCDRLVALVGLEGFDRKSGHCPCPWRCSSPAGLLVHHDEQIQAARRRHWPTVIHQRQ